MLPNGKYKAVVVSAVVKQPPGRDPLIEILFALPENDNAEMLGTIWLATPLKKGSQIALSALSVNWQNEADLSRILSSPLDLVGRAARLVFEGKDFQGKMQAKYINDVSGKAGASEPVNLTPEQIAAMCKVQPDPEKPPF